VEDLHLVVVVEDLQVEEVVVVLVVEDSLEEEEVEVVDKIRSNLFILFYLYH